MDPSPSEIEYAKEQIEEANRRLDTIYDRVGEHGAKYIIKEKEEGDIDDDDAVEVTTSEIEFTTTRESDLKDALEHMDFFEEEDYEKTQYTEINEELVGQHIQNVIIDCQLCIELAVKAMFKLTGKDHPFAHSITFEDAKTEGFYYEIPDDFSRKEEIVRVIFLTQFWGEFYELAKYGSPQLNVRPEMIFELNDGARAVWDAEFCISVAQDLLEFVNS